jgi:fumarylacetoacetate (FAA) hydrolase
VKLAHVRERNGPAGAPWRLAAALDAEAGHWIDLDVARRRAVAANGALAHDRVLFRQPVTTLDDHLGRGLRVESLAELVEPFEPRGDDDDAVLAAADLAFGPPILRPPSLRDFYAFERHVATVWARRGGEVPEAWYRLPVFYFSNTSEIRGPGDPVWAPRGCAELDYELEVAALIDTPAVDLPAERGEEAIGGYTILSDWSARDLQRDETTVRLGPAKGKDFASSIGPWLVTPDEVMAGRAADATAPDLAMTAAVNGTETSRGTWAAARFSFGDMVARASADVRLRPGDLLGSGTVGTGCLLEVREETLGRYLEPGDEVVLRIDRLGELRTPIVERPATRAAAMTR